MLTSICASSHWTSAISMSILLRSFGDIYSNRLENRVAGYICLCSPRLSTPSWHTNQPQQQQRLGRLATQQVSTRSF